jgi:probable rRNA maturation factor
VNVALVSDARVRALNREYRRRDYATDVLSFPSVARRTTSPAKAGSHTGSGTDPAKAGSQTVTEPFLGDIVIARGLARRQARKAGHDEATEWRVLALHGLLHLLGYDHEHDNGEMARVERRLRRKAGLKDALIERAAQ